MNTPLYILIVLYNQCINDIASLKNFQCIKEKRNIKIIICDNSNAEYRKKNSQELEREEYRDFIYISNDGNIGLSKSYNRALRLIEESAYWVMLADDDTMFSMEYLYNVWETAQGTEYSLISGILYSNNQVFSPISKYSVFRQRMNFINAPGVYNNIYAVNSGLTIHSSIFEKIGMFDERLFLDMVDYNFMEQLTQKNVNEVCIVEGKIEQSFSGESSGGWKSDIHRFKILKKDMKNFYKINKKNSFAMYLTLVKRLFHIVFLNCKFR